MKTEIKKTMPTTCPSCSQVLKVSHLVCDHCGTGVEGNFPFSILTRLTTEEQNFVIEFIKASGSLKDMATSYSISYPTVRNLLDSIIDKVKTIEGEFHSNKDG